MDLYIRRPFPVEALQFTGSALQAEEIDSWLGLWGDVRHYAERFIPSTDLQYVEGDVIVPVIQVEEHLILITDSGNYHVPLNCWIVKQEEGNLAVMNTESFNNIYERVSND